MTNFKPHTVTVVSRVICSLMGSNQLTAVVVLLCFCIAKCEVYYIVPSNIQVCSTLEHFIDSIYDYSIETNVTLILLQGEHNLHSELKAINSSEFFMHSDAINTLINCDGIGSLTLNNVTSVQIRNLAFMGCGENTLLEITLLTIYNTVFQGYYDSGAALILFNSVANITSSLFLSNTGTYQFPLDQFFYQGDDYKQVGGAIAAYQSKLWITECRFHGNSAEVGGALFIEETTVSIRNTIFENNFAKPHNNINQAYMTGGVMVIYWNCFVSIEYSTFSNNSGLIRLQGVLLVSIKNVVSVHRCLFETSKGHVFDIVESSLTDHSSVYQYNNSTTGAVSYVRWNSNVTQYKQSYCSPGRCFICST